MTKPSARELMAHPHNPIGRLLYCDELAARVERVLALHCSTGEYPYCPECSAVGRIVDWPCSTVRALDGEGGGDLRGEGADVPGPDKGR